MPQIDWNTLINGGAPKKRYSGANVKFLKTYNENKQKSLESGRPIFDEIISFSIQWPGCDETVRRVEPQDIAEYPDKWAAFQAGNQTIESGTPLSEWPPLPGSTLRELQGIGFQTIEQLADANDDIKRRLGPTGRFVKMAKDWLEASTSTPAQVTALKQQLERELRRTAKLEHQVELLMQRVEGNEGTDLRPKRVDFAQEVDEVDEVEVEPEVEGEAPRRRGRPRKV